MPAIGLIDGFNLYYGIREIDQHIDPCAFRQHLWLDLRALLEPLAATDGHVLGSVWYFTAARKGDPAAVARQQVYWQALKHHANVITQPARFQRKTLYCTTCGPFYTYEEKETDVALATRLVEEAAARPYDAAYVVSADTDMLPGLEAARRLHPTGRLNVVFPPNRSSGQVRRRVSNTPIRLRQLSRADVAASVLPNTVKGQGKDYIRPAKWAWP